MTAAAVDSKASGTDMRFNPATAAAGVFAALAFLAFLFGKGVLPAWIHPGAWPTDRIAFCKSCLCLDFCSSGRAGP